MLAARPDVSADADVPVAPATAIAPHGACANCGTTRADEYCAHCGQHFLEDRLSFRVLLSELWERVTFERGLLRTMREMLTDPGGVARRYVQGQRRRYVSPLTYIFLGAALSLLLFQLYDEQMAAWVRENSARAGSDEHPILTPAQVELSTDLTMRLADLTTYVGLVMCALFALVLRFSFRRSGVNLVETSVLALFAFGQVYMLALPITAITTLGFHSMLATSAVLVPLYVLVCSVAGAQFFGRESGRPIRAGLKSAVSFLIAYLLFTFMSMAAVMGYTLLTLREGLSALPTT